MRRPIPILPGLALLALAGLASARPAPAQGAAPTTSSPAARDGPGAALEAYLRERVERDAFSGSVLVSRAGETVLAAGYGPANREHGVPCTPRTRYRIGSLTKQLTAVAVPRLQEAGALHVRDALELYVEDLGRWEAARFEGELLSTVSRGAMLAPNLGEYGYGVVISERGGHAVVHHSGGTFGFRSCMLRLVEERLTVVVLSNAGWSDPTAIARRLAELELGP